MVSLLCPFRTVSRLEVSQMEHAEIYYPLKWFHLTSKNVDFFEIFVLQFIMII